MRAPHEVRIALAGGGSGGHLFPGLALARTLLPEGGKPLLYGSGKAAETEWIGRAAEAIRVDAPMLPGSKKQLPAFVTRMAKAIHHSLAEMRVRRPDLVVGLGGYASVAPGVAALMSGCPLLLLEQNAVPGKANLLLSRLGGTMAATFPGSISHLTRAARARARVLGNPVRPELFCGERDAAKFGLSPARPILLVMGGSQGAMSMNRRVADAAAELGRRELQVIWLAGRTDEAMARDALERAGVPGFVRAFSADMATIYRTADLVLCRAGGTTVAELAALGKPSVLVPYPHHKDRHQEYNAGALVKAGAALLVPEEELTVERIGAEVAELALDRSALAAMSLAALTAAVPDAADRVARFAAELIAGGRR